VIDEPRHPYSINDVGCGYGALATYLAARGDDFAYIGYDISSSMIDAARRRFANSANVTFAEAGNALALASADFTVASGIFNVRLSIEENRWRSYVLEMIDRLAAASGRGFAFNMLTSYSDRDRMRSNLYYGDPSFYFDYCMREFGRRAALMHDYELYEFTVIVRKGAR
jgi:ubiquinone/menaquinone biosynthesis C-methylase UbiE